MRLGANELFMKKTFYSNGKLLITGEYLVLDGAQAFALPTKFGQYLDLETGKNQEIKWRSFDKDGSLWLEETITFADIKEANSTAANSIKNTLIEILHQAYLLRPDFLTLFEGYVITTRLTFPKFWGLGTSSTLINNIAQWLEIDAFELLNNSFGGSGYDIACAQNDTSILYQLINGKPNVDKINFNPDFSDQLYFVYLNKKQSSKSAIAGYHAKQMGAVKQISVINRLTQAAIHAKTLAAFANCLEAHESVMSEILEMKTAKEALFSDFGGTIKSLGAWGGDFVLAISKENPISYFKDNGFDVVIPYSEMIL